MEDKVKFERKIIESGDSLCITIPKEIIQYLNLKKADTIQLIGDKSTKGTFAAFWKKT